MTEERKTLAKKLRESHDLLCRALVPIADSFVVSQVRQELASVISELEKEEIPTIATEEQT